MKKLLIVVLIFILLTFSSKAQYITIPDQALRENILQSHPSCMNASNQMDTTCSEIINATYFAIGEPVGNWQGFQYFRNLQILKITDDMGYYPAIPATVQQLVLWGSNLTDANFPALPPGLLKLDILSNGVHNLPALPASLTHLKFLGALLSALPTLPAGLTSLTVSQTSIAAMPSPLPAGLDTLDCSDNHMSYAFAGLPAGLKYFNCGGNGFISSLGPSLPSTLIHLDCSGNETLTSIPALPAQLDYFNAVNCRFTSLSAFPSTIKFIDLGNNLLTSLPTLPDSLQNFNCTNNQITIMPALPAPLRMLDCSYNQLTSFTGSTFPSQLYQLNCSYNQLTSLPAFTASWGMTFFDCSYNQLTGLPALPPNINYFMCNNNQLTSLPAMPSQQVVEFWCNQNQLSSLPTLPNTLRRLVCDHNNITCLPYLPNLLDEVWMDSIIKCVPNYPPNCSFDGYPYAFLIPICTPVNNVDHCQVFPTMTGLVYNDNNNNLIKDADEPVGANIRVQFSDGTVTYTNNDGQYTIWADTIGTCVLNCSNPIYFTSVPANINFNFSTYDTIVINNFALQATAVVDSMSIFVTPINWAARPGFAFPYLISYENSGTTSLTPTIDFHYDNTRLMYDSSSNAAVNNTGSSLQVTQPMVSGARNSFIGYFRINPAAQIGDTIFVDGHANANAITAYDSIYTRIRGAYDPNEKSATPVMSRAQVVAGQYINYSIGFQNTGTDTAFNVVITDTLSGLLEKETLQILHSSHLCKVTQKGNVIYFEFNNILLPDSNVNESKSHGFVSFRIRPKGFVVDGTNIPNKAAIYFDYNAAVITNTAITQIMTPTTPVPLKLISFNVTRQTKNTANVYWSTTNEINVKKFFIETSFDGSNYTGIASKDALDGAYNNYTTAVAITDNDIIYFRLKMIDIDGNFSYSHVVVLKNDKTNHAFSFLNNPAKDVLTIRLNDESLKNTPARIINAQGSVVKTILLQIDRQDINIKNLPSGTYVLQTVKGSSSFVIRN